MQSYTRPTEKVAGIKTMSAQTYEILLSSPQLEKDLVEGLARSQHLIEASNFNDVRTNNNQAANDFLFYLVNNYHHLNNHDLLLKTAYIQVLFANEYLFNKLKKESAATVADYFQTDVDNVKCKRALDRRIKELQSQSQDEASKKPYQK